MTVYAQTVERTEPVEFGDVARGAWSEMDSTAGELSIDASKNIVANQERLHALLLRVFECSLSRADGDCSVSVRCTGDRFIVEDDAGPVPHESVDSMCRYGWAEEDGIGMALVRTIAEAHGWEFDISETEDGLRFEFDQVR